MLFNKFQCSLYSSFAYHFLMYTRSSASKIVDHSHRSYVTFHREARCGTLGNVWCVFGMLGRVSAAVAISRTSQQVCAKCSSVGLVTKHQTCLITCKFGGRVFISISQRICGFSTVTEHGISGPVNHLT